jgi:hypothetical protein
MLGASCLKCKLEMTLRQQKRVTKSVPTFSMMWSCEKKCGQYLMVEYRNHSKSQRPKRLTREELVEQRYAEKIRQINAQTHFPGVRRIRVQVRWLENRKINRGDIALVAMGTKIKHKELGYFSLQHSSGASNGHRYNQFAFACKQDRHYKDGAYVGKHRKQEFCFRQSLKECQRLHCAKLYGRVIGIAHKREQASTKLKFRLPKLRFTEDGILTPVALTGVVKRSTAKVPGINDALFLEAIARVEQIVRKDLPALFRDDVCQDMLTDVWEQRIQVYELTPKLAGKYVAEQNRLFGNKKRMLSLENHVGDEDSNLHIGDTLEAADPGESSLTRAIRRKQLELKKI